MFTVSATQKSGAGPALLSTGLSRLPHIVSAALVVLLGIRGAALVTDLTGSKRLKSTGAAAVSAPALPPSTDIAALVGANLFGGGTSAAGSQGPVPVSNVPLVLVGVLAATDPALGVAILGPTSDAAKVYLVKDIMPGGVKLHAVKPDRVLIDRGGMIESLLLPRQSSPGSGPGVRPPASPLPVPPMANVAERAQQLVQLGPTGLSQILRPQVVVGPDGKQQGFRVFPGGNREAFAKLGLQAGDLVTAINGTALDDPGVGTNVFNTLATSPNARVTVLRDNKPHDVVVNVNQALSEAERATVPSP
ncbi:MAG: hypothetical protein RLZZ200_316 [Pseudomonadota bacterium]|jgi:general secretion pathway protein C